MQYRTLGEHGPAVSAIGFGAMPLSSIYGPANDAESIATLQHALDTGTTFVDTAESYGNGHNEEIVGRAIRGRREQVVLATKFGGGAGPASVRGGKGRPEYVSQAIENSLRRLGVDYVDLYYLHRVDPTTPIEDTVGAMAELVKQGKVRFLGLSEAAPATIRRAQAVHPITALQTEYSLFSREPEAEILPTVHDLGIGFVAYSPLGRGQLTGQFMSQADLDQNDRRRNFPRMQGENLERNARLLQRIAEIAAANGITPPQLALAWLLHQGQNIVPIPGTRHQDHWDADAAAVDVNLDPETLGQLDELTRAGAVAGERGHPEYMSGIDRG